MRELGIVRTALFVPGNRPDRVDKAVGAGADAVIIDLEDAVPLDSKEETRSKVREKILEHWESRLIVRVNSLDSRFFQGDLEELVEKELECIMIPKVESAADVREIYDRLLKVEKTKRLDYAPVLVIVMIETARGVQNVFQILSETADPPRLFTAAFGAADYAFDLGVELTKEGDELFYPRSRIAVACRAAGVEPPLDTPFMIDLKDIEALKADARRAKQLGFQGKLCIHPNQIEPCHTIFTPTDGELLYAKSVIQAFEEAEAKGISALQLDGKFIDYAVVKRARRILEAAAYRRPL
jgi:citrate lyase subunit beta/citryl-CoA lyase